MVNIIIINLYEVVFKAIWKFQTFVMVVHVNLALPYRMVKNIQIWIIQRHFKDQNIIELLMMITTFSALSVDEVKNIGWFCNVTMDVIQPEWAILTSVSICLLARFHTQMVPIGLPVSINGSPSTKNQKHKNGNNYSQIIYLIIKYNTEWCIVL